MKRNLLTILLLAGLHGLYAQSPRPAADRIDTKKGPLLVQPVSHASLVLTWTTKPST
jgi:hypothetical protein